MTENDSKPVALNADDFLTFTEVSKGLPNIKPRIVQAKLRKLYDALATESKSVLFNGCPVARAELRELFHDTFRTGYSTNVISPAGARLLVRLYQASALDMQPKKEPTVPTSELQAYCDSEPQLLERDKERKAKRAAYEAMVANPAAIPEAEFNWSVLNDVFWKLGKDVRETNVGGLTVYKHVASYSSNSGKSRDFKVLFSWKTADGVERRLDGFSNYESNRRNDENRNWGLYE